MNYRINSFLCRNNIQAVSACLSQLIINSQLMLDKQILFLVQTTLHTSPDRMLSYSNTAV